MDWGLKEMMGRKKENTRYDERELKWKKNGKYKIIFSETDGGPVK